jgi:hypothetical protein
MREPRADLDTKTKRRDRDRLCTESKTEMVQRRLRNHLVGRRMKYPDRRRNDVSSERSWGMYDMSKSMRVKSRFKSSDDGKKELHGLRATESLKSLSRQFGSLLQIGMARTRTRCIRIGWATGPASSVEEAAHTQ